jgi:O-antigen ligase
VSNKTKSKTLKNQGDRLIYRILAVSVIITLYFNTNLQDPFNSPKMWILTLLAASLCIYVFPSRQSVKTTKSGSTYNKKIYFVIYSFIISLFLSTVFTDSIYTAFFGASGRRLGFLTYISLSIVLLVLIKFARNTSPRIYAPVLMLSLVLVVYGFLQGSGNDFVAWNNPYNSIILTFGNPNYASAMLAIFAAVLLGGCLEQQLSIYIKVLSISLVILMIVLIQNSKSRQGLLAFIIASLTQLVFIAYFKKKILGRLFIFLLFTSLSLIALAMLQIGPLANLIYKQSVSIRGYYWRAAFEMFKANPIFGIGIDRYGEYFKEYRETNYSLTFSFELNSSNAHNVPLQFLAMGGAIVGISYALISLLVFIAGIKLILKSDASTRNYHTTLFSAWIAFQAQSVISIDNIGLTIWGWILSGLILGLYGNSGSLEEDINLSNLHTRNSLLTKQMVSYICILITSILCLFLYRGEALILKQRSVYNPKIEENRVVTKELGLQMINTPLVDPAYRFMSSTYLLTSGYEDLGFKILDELLTADPRNLDYLNAKAGFLEQLNRKNEAIEFRRLIHKYDPWNARNLLTLGEDFKSVNDKKNMDETLSQILAFASNHPIAIEAREKLTNE